MKKEKDLISIIVPIYNSEKYLENCLDSIVNQSYKNLEIILVDDGSKDNSGPICDKYAKKDKRIKVIHKENGGVSSARNKGLDIAKGKFIAFCDSDDYVHVDWIKVMYSNMIKYDVDMSICNYYDVYNTKEQKAIKLKSHISTDIRDFHINQSIFVGLTNKLFKKNLVNDLRLDKNLYFGEDMVFLVKYLEKCKSFYYDEKPLYYYPKHDDSLSNRFSWNEKKTTIIDSYLEVFDILKKYEFNTYKYYYLEYFYYLNDIYHNYSEYNIEKNELKKIYKDLMQHKEYNFRIKFFIFIKYHFFDLFQLFERFYLRFW